MNTILSQSEKWLNELGIRTSHSQLTTCLLKVNRDDMCKLANDEQEAYDMILAELRSAVSKKVLWAMKDDIWYYLETF